MRLISKRTLRVFWEKHPDAKQQLLSWYKDVRAARYQSSMELMEELPNCRSIGSGRYIFNIKGNDYRLIVRMSFPLQTVWIRFIGTHADYDKIDPLNV